MRLPPSHFSASRDRLRRRGDRGFTVIGLLIVVLIIFILVGKQWGGDNGNPSLHKISIERSNNVACLSNRTITKTYMQTWAIDHPGQVPTIEDLEAANMHVPGCNEGGTWTILPDGQIHCTKHDERLEKVVLSSFPPDQAETILRHERIQAVLRAHYPDSPYLSENAGRPNPLE